VVSSDCYGAVSGMSRSSRHRQTAGRPRRESLATQRAQAQLAEKDARWNLALQIAGVAVAAAGVLISLFVWHPWVHAHPHRIILPQASVQMLPNSHSAFVPALITRIPPPPDFPASERIDHCSRWWRTWFWSERAAEVAVPAIQVSAPPNADVAVVGASIKVFRTYRPPAVSYIACLHGAGAEVGTRLDVNLSRPNAVPTIVAADGSDRPLALPNAVINVDPGHTEYIAVIPHGAPLMFEWSIVLTTVVAQRTKVFVFGSPPRPLRTWLGPAPPATREYDYSIQAHRWSPTDCC
jgi:hypothetical protein